MTASLRSSALANLSAGVRSAKGSSMTPAGATPPDGGFAVACGVPLSAGLDLAARGLAVDWSRELSRRVSVSSMNLWISFARSDNSAFISLIKARREPPSAEPRLFPLFDGPSQDNSSICTFAGSLGRGLPHRCNDILSEANRPAQSCCGTIAAMCHRPRQRSHNPHGLSPRDVRRRVEAKVEVDSRGVLSLTLRLRPTRISL